MVDYVHAGVICDDFTPRFYFDSEHVGVGDVIQPGGTTLERFTSQGNVFLMYTFGGNGESKEITGGRTIKGSKLEIGVAVSQDGAHWSRIEGPSPYGAIVEVGETPDDFDALFVGWPSVLEVGSSYRMYYSTYNPIQKKFMIGMAVAPDGLLKWEKKGVVFAGTDSLEGFDAMGASRRHVLAQPDGSYRMYYEAISHKQQHSIGVASSKDGITWERLSDQPVFRANEDPTAWDGGGVGSPHLVWLPNKRRWRLYYVGNPVKVEGVPVSNSSGGKDNSQVGTASGIGVAESLDEDGLVFERIL